MIMTPEMDRIIYEINHIIRVHKELHGKDGIVDYAIVDDCMRRIEGEFSRGFVEMQVAQILEKND